MQTGFASELVRDRLLVRVLDHWLQRTDSLEWTSVICAGGASTRPTRVGSSSSVLACAPLRRAIKASLRPLCAGVRRTVQAKLKNGCSCRGGRPRAIQAGHDRNCCCRNEWQTPLALRRALLLILAATGSDLRTPLEGFADPFNAVLGTEYCSCPGATLDAADADASYAGSNGPASVASWYGKAVYANPPFTAAVIARTVEYSKQTARCLLLLPEHRVSARLRADLHQAGFRLLLQHRLEFDRPMFFSRSAPIPGVTFRTHWYYKPAPDESTWIRQALHRCLSMYTGASDEPALQGYVRGLHLSYLPDNVADQVVKLLSAIVGLTSAILQDGPQTLACLRRAQGSPVSLAWVLTLARLLGQPVSGDLCDGPALAEWDSITRTDNQHLHATQRRWLVSLFSQLLPAHTGATSGHAFR